MTLEELVARASGAAPVVTARSRGTVWRRFTEALRSQWLVTASIVFLVLEVIFAILGPVLLGGVATTQDLPDRLHPPFTFDNGILGILGTDALGQSMLARLIVGTQLTFVIVLAAVVVSVVLGFVIGLIASYFGGWVDLVVMRFVDIFMTIPTLLLALSVLFIFSGSIPALIIVLAIANTPVIIRSTRAQGLEVRQRTFIQAAKSMGAGSVDILFRQMAGVVAPAVLTVALLEFATVMLEVASLSYLGLGIQPPAVTWGTMVADGKTYLRTAWWVSAFPGIVITLTVTALLLVSNYLRGLADPMQANAIRAAQARRRYRRTRKGAAR